MLGLLMALWLTRTPAQSLSGNSSTSYTCNFAKVKANSERDEYVTIQSGPGIQFKKIGHLHSGRGVYICDEQGGWFKIYYSAPDGPCGPTSSKGLDVQKTKGCHSGWVEKKWIDVVSG
jgi:hypothetical protein